MPIRIIWADDDDQQMNEWEPVFNAHGVELIKCNSIAKALRELEQGNSNNLLLDIDFPNSPKEGFFFWKLLNHPIRI